MTSNFYAFSFERPSASRNGSLAAQLPTVPSSRSGMVGQAASSIDTFVTVNSSLPQLSRRADSGTVAAAAAAGAGNPAARNAAAANVAAAGPLPQPRVNVTAAQAARDRRRLIHTKRSITSRFRAWHRGLAYWGLWNEAQQFYFMQFIGIPPRAGPFPGFNRPNRAQFPVLQRMAGRRQPLRGFMRRVVNRVRRRNQNRAPQDPKERLAEMLEEPLAAIVEPAGCRFRKRLGVGGQGAVFLIDLVGQDGRKIPIVAKACVGRNIGQDDALRQEKEAMMCLTGARHAVQRVVLQGLSYPTPKKTAKDRLDAVLRAFGNVNLGQRTGRLSQPRLVVNQFAAAPLTPLENMRQARADLDFSNEIILMEYMARGSVQDLIEKVAKNGTRVSDRALWMILKCLFKACVAMAYPLRFVESGKDLFSTRHAQQEEVVPAEAATQLPQDPMLHFDLDPQNALIGDFGPPGDAHEFVPSFKVSDFGLAEYKNPARPFTELDLWELRLYGKPQIFVPEQFTQEWEYEASIDKAHLDREETAGNYHWWSNLFQVGWIMWSLITQSYPPVPPTMHSYQYPDPDVQNTNNNNAPLVPGLTYGSQLLEKEFDGYDRILRTLIVRLLDHNPTKRPKIAWLEKTLDEYARRQVLSDREPDREFRKAMHRLFGAP